MFLRNSFLVIASILMLNLRDIAHGFNKASLFFKQMYNIKQEDIKTSHSESTTALSVLSRKISIGLNDEGNAFPKELYRHSLLSAADEFDLAKQYKLGVAIIQKNKELSFEYGRRITETEMSIAMDLPVEQLRDAIEKAELAKDSLVQSNMRLVFHVARFHSFRGVTMPDLIQEGTCGLIRAVEKFDPDRGFRFSTYATWWIKQSISRAIADKSRLIRVPVHVHDMLVSISKAEYQFKKIHLRSPTPFELADQLALPVEKVESLMKTNCNVRSADDPYYNQRTSGVVNSHQVLVGERLVSEEMEPPLINEVVSTRSELRRAMKSLSEREAQIVEMRFGLTNGNPMTLEEIGKAFNVTRERIRQIESRALSKLRNPTKANEIKELFRDKCISLYSESEPISSSETASKVSSKIERSLSSTST